MSDMKFDMEEIQRRMDRNPIVNPEVARREKARLDKEASLDAAQVAAQETIDQLKRLLK